MVQKQLVLMHQNIVAWHIKALSCHAHHYWHKSCFIFWYPSPPYRYLVPADLTVGQFVYVVRKRIKLSAEKAIFIFVKNTLPPTGMENGKATSLLPWQAYVKCSHSNFLAHSLFTAALMSAIYEENKDEDGFLYMTYSGENTFGLL